MSLRVIAQQNFSKFENHLIFVRQEDSLEVLEIINNTKKCLEDLSNQLGKYKLPEPSFWEGRRVRVLYSGSINPMTVASSLSFIKEIRSIADAVFKQFQVDISKFIVFPSSDDLALVHMDFSEVMRKRAAFDVNYKIMKFYSESKAKPPVYVKHSSPLNQNSR